jgi:hypothetical protein
LECGGKRRFFCFSVWSAIAVALVFCFCFCLSRPEGTVLKAQSEGLGKTRTTQMSSVLKGRFIHSSERHRNTMNGPFRTENRVALTGWAVRTVPSGRKTKTSNRTMLFEINSQFMAILHLQNIFKNLARII